MPRKVLYDNQILECFLAKEDQIPGNQGRFFSVKAVLAGGGGLFPNADDATHVDRVASACSGLKFEARLSEILPKTCHFNITVAKKETYVMR